MSPYDDHVIERWIINLAFDSVCKILLRYHSNEMSLTDLLHGSVYLIGFLQKQGAKKII